MNQQPAGTIELTTGVAAALAAHARAAFPRECCGLLVGVAWRIEECVPAPNVDPDPSRYQVDPAVHIALSRRLRGTDRSVVGVYHSHPRGRGEPSPSDVAEAAYPEFVHVIISDVHAETAQIRAFRIVGGMVIPLALIEGPAGQSS